MKKLPMSLILALLIYLVTFFVVPPFYEYPIGDDWTYSKVAKYFYETGTFKTLQWYGQSLIAQIWWAWLFLLPFGFSFSALHLSNAVMGGVALLFFYLLLGHLQVQKKEAFWGCCLLIVSPPFIFLSRTFHTDLPFLALYLAAAWAYAKGLSNRSGAWLLMGSLFLGLSVLIRQVGIFLPLVLFFMLPLDRNRWPFWHRASLLIPFLSLGAFTLWQHHFFKGIPPANLLLATYALRLDKVVSDFLRIPFATSLYFGYLLSPILLPCAFGLIQKRRIYPRPWRLFLLGWVVFGIGILSLGLQEGLWMPDYFPKGFHLKGSGPFPYALMTVCGMTGAAVLWSVYYEPLMARLKKGGTVLAVGCLLLALFATFPPVRLGLLSWASSLLTSLYPFFSERIHLYQTLETWQTRLPLLYPQIIFRLFGISFIAFLLFGLLPFFMKRWKGSPLSMVIEKPEALLHLASLAYLLFLVFLPVTTDRYLFPILPSAILLALRAARLIPYKRGLVFLFLWCVFVPSLLHTDRVIQRVGALWGGGHRLLSQGIPVEKIDAGFVFNGWYLYGHPQGKRFEGTDKAWTEEGWWVVDSEYRVTTTPPDGYLVFGKIYYRDLLTPGPQAVYLTRRRSEGGRP